MKQVFVDLKTGDLEVADVPLPAVQPGGVLVRNHASLISAGTEASTLSLAEKSLLGKALARPDLARKVIDKARREGPLTALQQAMGRLERPEPLGYSCAGEVVAVGSEVHDLRVGDRVACAGAGYASHAEVVYVPRNLCVKVPDGVDLRHAAFTTLGAIALQGLRNADARLGESVCVIGLGLLGQIAVQLARAAGCRVVGVDLDAEKVRRALDLGMDAGFERARPGLADAVRAACGGAGADAVLVTAATPSNDPVELAGEVARERGRVVVVGAVGMDVPRPTFYEKELALHVSRSYGPGRYDREYEENGRDYPLAYVRWTENRNMQAFVALLAAGALRLDPVITHEFDVADAPRAYATLEDGAARPLGVLLRYSGTPTERKVVVAPPSARAPRPGALRIGVVGAGIHGAGTLLPALRKASGVELAGIATATGLSARRAAERFGFRYCATDADALIDDPEIDAVVILTRNSTHVPLAARALERGKHVLVEKPLAVDEAGLERIVQAWEASPAHLMVGFNRRHSPLAAEIREALRGRAGPLAMTYRVCAEAVPPGHWVYDAAEGGGRVVTEACHFIDFMRAVAGAPIEGVAALGALDGAGGADPRVRENAALAVRFADGSVGTLLYTNRGEAAFGKERFECFSPEASVVLEDFKELRIRAGARSRGRRGWLASAKGHAEEVEAFVRLCARPKAEGEDLFRSAVEVTRATFAAREALATGGYVRLGR